MVEWAKSFQVAVVGLSGVFIGLILLELCVTVFARIFVVVERFGTKKDPS